MTFQAGQSKLTRTLSLVAGVTAANGKPDESAVFDTVGVPSPQIDARGPTYGVAKVYNTQGTGNTVAYVRIWIGYKDPTGDLGKWFPAGDGSDGDKGKLNGGASFGETSTDKLRHAGPVTLPGIADRIYAEVGTIGGAGVPTINVDLALSIRPDFS